MKMISLAAAVLAVGSMAAGAQIQNVGQNSSQTARSQTVVSQASATAVADASVGSVSAAVTDVLDSPSEGSQVAAAPLVVRSSAILAGDYVEARSCSVFAGACHYN